MIVYIEEPRSFMSADILTKNTRLKELQKNLQRLLDADKTMEDLSFLNRKFKNYKILFEQKTKDTVLVTLESAKVFFLKGVL